jgi:putative hydrolase of the HAD superfamily
MFPIEAVLFDYGMVLSAPRNPAVWTELSSLSGLTEQDLERSYWATRDAYDEGILSGEEFWRGIGAAAGFTYSSEQLRALNAADVRLWGDLNEPMVDWVKALHLAGIKTGVLSNMGDAMAEGLIARWDWIGGFHHAVWSHELRMRKPQPEIYAVAVKGLGVPASSILFVDDKAENIVAAEAAGMHGMLYSDHDRFVREMAERGYGALLTPQK